MSLQHLQQKRGVSRKVCIHAREGDFLGKLNFLLQVLQIVFLRFSGGLSQSFVVPVTTRTTKIDFQNFGVD